MKTAVLVVLATLFNIAGFAQQPEVLVFKHELRWTDETRFPNFFQLPAVRDTIFKEAKFALINYLKVPDIKLPDKVSYRIINGFGKTKLELPAKIPGNEPIVGISSCITRATAGYAMLWNLQVIIKQNNRTILEKEISHELEYCNPSGYVTSIQWLSADEFREIFVRLLREALGVLPSSDEKIVVGVQEAANEEARFRLNTEAKEGEARALFAQPERDMLILSGEWEYAGNLSAALLTANDTLLKCNYKDKATWTFPMPSFGKVMASLFSDITGFETDYDQKVLRQKNGTLFFKDGQKLGIKLKWLELTRRFTSGDVIQTQLLAPYVAELYDENNQIGYFVYSRQEATRLTDTVNGNPNVYAGNQSENNFVIDVVHRIEGSLSDKPVFAEYNENQEIIQIRSGDELLGVMIVLNCNPESRFIGNVMLSKNKRVMTSSSQNFGKPSLENVRKAEWYPIYFSESSSAGLRKICIETLVCLFFGIGNM